MILRRKTRYKTQNARCVNLSCECKKENKRGIYIERVLRLFTAFWVKTLRAQTNDTSFTFLDAALGTPISPETLWYLDDATTQNAAKT